MKNNNVIINILKGAVVGIACIVPGVSGGTLAVILGIYDKILYAISSLKKEFKKSISFLWPIVLGALIGLGAMIWPLTKAIEYFPLPTVLLFIGLIIGGLPGLFDKIKRVPNVQGSIAMVLAVCIPIGLCFISNGKDVSLGTDMEWWMYFVVVLIGIVASCALTIPGISGSMLLLILGFWTPILNCVMNIFSGSGIEVFHNISVILLFGIGIVIGFFLISKLMTYLFRKFNYVTYMSIIGFIIGSLFAIIYAIKDDMFPNGNMAAHIVVGVILCLVGFAISFLLICYSKKHPAKPEEKSSTNEETN